MTPSMHGVLATGTRGQAQYAAEQAVPAQVAGVERMDYDLEIQHQ